MKKLILMLLLLISIFSFSKENFTENEKTIALKQFVEFQKALKNKDINTLKNYIDNPVYGLNHIDGKSYTDYEIPVSHDEIVKYKTKFLNNIKEMALLKVDLNSNTIKSYKKGELEITAGFSTTENNEDWGLDPDEKTFEVFYYYDDPEFPGYNRYVFKFENNKLKLHALYVGP
ncbi:hypothetical protein [Sebaldella termitidis]|uniref:hypothetical protein n=1 Tax=Sebaldella termitidis TaxID=826 RepID=UPI003EB8A277